MDRNLAQLIGKNLRVAREAHGWTQARAAREVSLSHEFYARIERGIGLPSVVALIRIADNMGVTPHRILGEAIEKQAEEYARRGLSDKMEYIVRFVRAHPEYIPLLLLVIKTFEEAQGRI